MIYRHSLTPREACLKRGGTEKSPPKQFSIWNNGKGRHYLIFKMPSATTADELSVCRTWYGVAQAVPASASRQGRNGCVQRGPDDTPLPCPLHGQVHLQNAEDRTKGSFREGLSCAFATSVSQWTGAMLSSQVVRAKPSQSIYAGGWYGSFILTCNILVHRSSNLHSVTHSVMIFAYEIGTKSFLNTCS